MAFRSLRFSPRQQQGNTLVGFIIGLVIGLVIAVVVALSITKGQTPFTDKAPKNGKATDEASGQIADPNKPMYGNKEAVKKANSEFERDSQKQAPADALQKVVDNIQAQGQAPAKAPAPAPAPTPAATSPAAPPPVNSAAPPAQAAAPAPALPGEDKFVYYLQAGAFREVGDAENTRAKLALLGFEATVSDRATDAGVLHRVRMGPFTQVEAMNKARAKLSENGIDVAVVRNQK
ncbi:MULTISPECIES: SPOR domain-containing protein [unclassified Duganella]|uniref:SPOR domain-containing protein n=1 Tax=unclassified Duganella TaxID=2636909 RepID=UPI0007013207|nr:MULTISPECIES: SPOR domain-containing protein [unclassified Duganella]KQV55042.1 cell division protein [Duganella sp. Root336D2]KRB94333.1 cell division protein [Duganella sp. Root198D2]